MDGYHEWGKGFEIQKENVAFELSISKLRP